MFSPVNNITVHTQVALLELALDERRDAVNQAGTRAMVDTLRAGPASLKGMSFELHVTSNRGPSEIVTHMRIPKLPAGLCRKVVKREKVVKSVEVRDYDPTLMGLNKSLCVQRMKTGMFKGKTPLSTSKRSSTASDSTPSPSDPGKRNTQPW